MGLIISEICRATFCQSSFHGLVDIPHLSLARRDRTLEQGAHALIGLLYQEDERTRRNASTTPTIPRPPADYVL
jgi:hypothetical protein